MIMTLSGQREQFGQSCVKTTRKSLSVTLDALHCSLYSTAYFKQCCVASIAVIKLNALHCSLYFPVLLFSHVLLEYEITKLNALHCPLSQVCFLAYFKQLCSNDGCDQVQRFSLLFSLLIAVLHCFLQQVLSRAIIKLNDLCCFVSSFFSVIFCLKCFVLWFLYYTQVSH